MNLNTQYVFDGKLKRNLIIGMGLGVVCLVWSVFGDDEYLTRFWSNWLHNAVFFTGIAFMAMFFLSAQITAFAGWMSVIKRIWEAMSQFMWVGLILMGVMVIGVWAHLTHLYHWNTPGISDPGSPVFDKIIAGKRSFLNPGFFTFALLGVLGIWYYWAYKLRQASVAQDTLETPSYDYYKTQRKWAASFLPIGGFLSTVFLWQAVMSIDSHWYSTMFAWYSMTSLWLASLSMTIMLIIYLKSKGHLEYVTRDHLHDVGKFLFGISVFWTYLWFDQFMLIWYANNGEETIYYKERMNHYPVLFWGNLVLNFITPFLILMRNDTKRKFGTMFFVAAIVFFGHWWDFFYMIKPGARIAAHEATELAEGKHSQHEAAPLEEGVTATPGQEQTADHEAHSDGNVTKETTAGEVTTADTATVFRNQPLADENAAQRIGSATATSGRPTEGQPDHGTSSDTAHTPPAGVERSDLDLEAAEEDLTAEGSMEHPAGPVLGETHGGEHSEQVGAVHGGDKSFKLGYTFPGLQDLGVMIGFLSLFLFFFFNQLAKVSLVPLRDPYLEESQHHETGANNDGERDLDGDNQNQGHHDHH